MSASLDALNAKVDDLAAKVGVLIARPMTGAATDDDLNAVAAKVDALTAQVEVANGSVPLPIPVAA